MSDLQLLTTFACFTAIALENSRLKDIAHMSDVDVECAKWIAESERERFAIPAHLELSDTAKNQVVSLACFAPDFAGIGQFKELLFFFNRFKILETFQITNERFFRFIFKVSALYNQVPYHNWTHACDVTQHLVCQFITGRLDTVFSAHELFALLTAAICHDTNHEGFTNIFNVKAETPLGILFKDQSVMEMHHLTMSIPIITSDEVQLFQALPPDQTKKMWNLFIQLILATDMARHFDFVKRTNSLLDEGTWNINDPEQRLLAMKIVLKVADISNVSRPFELADKWCDILCQEFFRQGDVEKATGIGFTSPLNDRENTDKPKSQIGFYNFICIPLYNLLVRIFPRLHPFCDSVKSNLETWKSMVVT
jgi:hypothetical protein